MTHGSRSDRCRSVSTLLGGVAADGPAARRRRRAARLRHERRRAARRRRRAPAPTPRRTARRGSARARCGRPRPGRRDGPRQERAGRRRPVAPARAAPCVDRAGLRRPGPARRRRVSACWSGNAAVEPVAACASRRSTTAATAGCPTAAASPAPARPARRAPGPRSPACGPGGAATGAAAPATAAARGSARSSRHSTGTRGRSIARPSLTSSAGSTVSEPSTATATTMIEPVASEAKTTSPARYSPTIETITASPDTSTECPEVSAAISTASSWLRPRRRSSRGPLDVEQRVVDADGHAHQQDHARGRCRSRGCTCEARADSPVAAPTADSASRTGTPAATIAPNAISRITSVTGRLNVAADGQVVADLLVDRVVRATPSRPPRPAAPGYVRCTAFVAASSGSTSASSPRSVTWTVSAVPSGDVDRRADRAHLRAARACRVGRPRRARAGRARVEPARRAR